MRQLKVTYSLPDEGSKGCLHVKFACKRVEDMETIHFLAEIGEGMANISFREICFDFTAVEYARSSALGMFTNIANSAQQAKKQFTFRFGSAVSEIVHQMNLDKVLHVEADK